MGGCEWGCEHELAKGELLYVTYQSYGKPFLPLHFLSLSPYVAICPAGCPPNSQCTAPEQCM